MKYSVIVGRVLLGLIYFVFGLNYFLNFIPVPPDIPEPVKNFTGALTASRYFMPLLKTTEVLGGALMLSGFFVPLALVVLMPITLNIVLFHLFLAPDGNIMGITMLVIHAFLMWRHCEAYKPMLRPKQP